MHSVNLLRVMFFSLTLVLVAKCIKWGNFINQSFLDVAFHALVLGHGMDELLNIENIERFRSQIKVTFE
jgi:uncharacterized protein YebE (UPF0316 family)